MSANDQSASNAGATWQLRDAPELLRYRDPIDLAASVPEAASLARFAPRVNSGAWFIIESSQLDAPFSCVLEEGRLLVGFRDPEAPPGAALVEKVLCRNLREPAELAIDPRAIAWAEASEEQLSQARVSVTLRERARSIVPGAGSKPKRLEVMFELAPPESSGAAADDDAYFDEGAPPPPPPEATLLIAPPSTGAPRGDRSELHVDYPEEAVEGPVWVDVAEVSVRIENLFSSGALAILECELDHPEAAGAVAVLNAEGEEAPEISFTPGSDGVVRAWRRICVKCGPKTPNEEAPGALPEPSAPWSAPLRVRVSGGPATIGAQDGAFEAEAEAQLTTSPPAGPSRITLAVQERGANIAVFDLESEEDQPDAPAHLLPERLLEAASGPGPRRAPVLALRAVLLGKIEHKRKTKLEATAEILDADGALIVAEEVAPTLTFSQSGQSSGGPAQLAVGARMARIDVAAPSAPQLYREALGEELEIERPMTLRMRVRAGKYSAVLERPFRLRDPRPAPQLAIDLGANAIAVALSDGENGVVLAPMGMRMAQWRKAAEPQGAAAYFAPSRLSLDPDACWRPKARPETLWAVAPETAIRVEASFAAKALGRSTAIGVPAAFDAAEEACVRAPLSGLSPLGGVLRTARPVWTARSDPGVAQEHSAEKLVADTLHEIADLYVPAEAPMARMLGAQIALTHPVSFGGARCSRLRAAAQSLLKRLDHDPQANKRELFEDAVLRLAPASDAVAAYYASELCAGGPVRALVYELGAGALSVTLAQIEPVAQGARAARLSQIESRVGAELGGDAIDVALYTTVHRALAHLPRSEEDALGAAALYQRDLMAPFSPDSAAESARRLVKRNVAEAIEMGKKSLSAAAKAQMARAEKYAWPQGAPFEVQVGAFGEAADHWPVRISEPERFAGEGLEIAPGAWLARRKNALLLRLDKDLVASPQMMELVKFLVSTAPRHAFRREAGEAERAPADVMVISGRAALFPLVYEQLEAQIARGGLASALARREPPSEQEMKAASVLGALSLGLWDAQEPKIRRAILVSDVAPGRSGSHTEQRFHELMPESSADKLSGVAGRARLVEAPLGLKVDELKRDYWARYLLAPMGVGADAAAFALDPAASPPDGSWIFSPLALHCKSFDVTPSHTPLDAIEIAPFQEKDDLAAKTALESEGVKVNSAVDSDEERANDASDQSDADVEVTE